MTKQVYQLYNGIEIPQICFGPGIVNIDKHLNYHNIIKSVKDLYTLLKMKHVIGSAPNLGCRLFDTSSAYGMGENVLGTSLKSYERSKLFLCTKISNYDQRHKKVKDALYESMSRLEVDYIDLYLMHWPQKGKYLDTWKQMEELYSKGVIKAIGVCNFHIHHFEELYQVAEIKPMVHQYEMHPLFIQSEMSEFCHNENIQIMAYTPIGRGDDRLMNNLILQRIAKRYGKSIAQVILRWHLQKGNIPVIRTNSLKHLKDNLNIYDFILSDKEMIKIDSININSRLRYDSDNCNFNAL